jgi:hypothetical protein
MNDIDILYIKRITLNDIMYERDWLTAESTFQQPPASSCSFLEAMYIDRCSA